MEHKTYFLLNLNSISTAKHLFRKTIGRLHKKFIQFYKFRDYKYNLNGVDYHLSFLKLNISSVSRQLTGHSIVVEVNNEMATSFLFFMNEYIVCTFNPEDFLEDKNTDLTNFHNIFSNKFKHISNNNYSNILTIQHDDVKYLNNNIMYINSENHLELINKDVTFDDFMDVAFINHSRYMSYWNMTKDFLRENGKINHVSLFVYFVCDLIREFGTNINLTVADIINHGQKVDTGIKINVNDKLNGVLLYNSTASISTMADQIKSNSDALSGKGFQDGIFTLKIDNDEIKFRSSVSFRISGSIKFDNITLLTAPAPDSDMYKIAYEYIKSDTDDIGKFFLGR